MKLVSRIAPIAFMIALGYTSPVFGALACTGDYFSSTATDTGLPSGMQQNADL
jgi:hypothetical protein